MPVRKGRLTRLSLLLKFAAVLLVSWIGMAPVTAAEFDFSSVAARAKQLASQPYRKPEIKLPKEVQDLGYQHYGDIHFNPDKAIWRAQKLPFELQFTHEGGNSNTPVKISEITPDGIREIKFNPYNFNYGNTKLDPAKLGDLGYAGLRVHYSINTPKYKDEVLVFPAASYFRALGKGQHYGLSARGLAVDTALMSGEEFPRFTEYWLERPKPADQSLTIYALLDSRRVTGAYQFVLKPGSTTVMEVKARIFMRENVSKLGIAPLTSMFLHGENQHASSDDYRPEVHDSDGLSIASGTGEWIWRPLVDPNRLLVTSFALSNPVGFGLMQRDRDFHDYEDLDKHYERRPSAWVEPVGQWGTGRVELLELPTPDETNDNIGAYWVPDNPPQAGQSLDIEYRILWEMEKDTRPPASWVEQTRRGRSYTPNPDDSITFAVDFAGPALNKLAPTDKVEGIISVDANSELLDRSTLYNDVTHGRRLFMRLHRLDNDKPVEIRAYLRGPDNAVSETWSYVLPPGGP